MERQQIEGVSLGPAQERGDAAVANGAETAPAASAADAGPPPLKTLEDFRRMKNIRNPELAHEQYCAAMIDSDAGVELDENRGLIDFARAWTPRPDPTSAFAGYLAAAADVRRRKEWEERERARIASAGGQPASDDDCQERAEPLEDRASGAPDESGLSSDSAAEAKESGFSNDSAVELDENSPDDAENAWDGEEEEVAPEPEPERRKSLPARQRPFADVNPYTDNIAGHSASARQPSPLKPVTIRGAVFNPRAVPHRRYDHGPAVELDVPHNLPPRPPAGSSDEDTQAWLNAILGECHFLMSEVVFRSICTTTSLADRLTLLQHSMDMAKTGAKVGKAIAELKRSTVVEARRKTTF